MNLESIFQEVAVAMKRILVADDEEGIRESLNLILSEHYDIVFAADGQETLEQLAKGGFDLALLDIKMPKVDGLEIMKRLSQQRVATPVIVLSAYQSVELAREAIRLGAADYLPKPFERDQILEAVRGALKRV